MGRVFSLPSSGLRYLIGHALIYSDQMAICSPWLSDVDVRLPLYPGVDSRRMKLAAALRELDTDVDIYVRPEQETNEYALSQLTAIDNVRVIEVEDLHAKAIITDLYVYVGSANITLRGLFTNKELCQVVENEYRCVDRYIEEELDF